MRRIKSKKKEVTRTEMRACPFSGLAGAYPDPARRRELEKRVSHCEQRALPTHMLAFLTMIPKEMPDCAVDMCTGEPSRRRI